MKTRSCKAKGKRLVQLIKAKFLEVAPDLQDDDIKVPTTSEPGQDLHLSPLARSKFPFVIEAKNVEKLNVHQAFEQAKTHTKFQDPAMYREFDQIPLLVFAKNHTQPLVCLTLDDFLWLTN